MSLFFAFLSLSEAAQAVQRGVLSSVMFVIYYTKNTNCFKVALSWVYEFRVVQGHKKASPMVEDDAGGLKLGRQADARVGEVDLKYTLSNAIHFHRFCCP